MCEDYYAAGRRLPDYLPALLKEGTDHLEAATGQRLGDHRNPLLVSVRSGAPVSMPGMMITVLNVGSDRPGVEALIARSGNPRFGWDCYRRLIASYADGVAHHDRRIYDRILADRMRTLDLADGTELDTDSLRAVAEEYEAAYARQEGSPFPQDPQEQLRKAIVAVLDSWASPRAETYRTMNLVRGARGTAVTVQAMVFGNMGFLSGSGVSFTRNPWTGEGGMVTDFRFGVQGEDVVSGEQEASQEPRFQRLLPRAYRELQRAGGELEASLRDMQDLEFTVQEGELYLLQTRDGKRSPLAALRIAVELAEEKIVTPQEAVERVRDIDMEALVEQRAVSDRPPLARGIPASAGIATGAVALSGPGAVDRAKERAVILMRGSLTPDDLAGVSASAGVISARGNRMAHAVVVARQLGKACIVNVPRLSIDPAAHKFVLGGKEFREGAVLSMNSRTGEIFEGAVKVVEERPEDLLVKIRAWGGARPGAK